jgi:RNA polymerase sigma factor (sigma-70 family)
VTPKSLIEPARHAGTALLRSQTDARLVDLTRDGNERAFEAIVHRYHRPLLRYCSRLLSAARADDAVQQTFLSAHRAIHAGDAELNLRPWLYRIAHNASLNLLRQNGFDHDQVSEEIDGVETPPQAFERGERLRTVVAAVQELPERQRNAIVLQAVEGRSYDEIATELGVSDGAVRQLLNRARTTLREAAAALTPTGFLTRIAASGGEASSVSERVAQVVTGAGGGALLAKAGATIVVAGAVAGGAATGALPGTGDHSRSADAATAATRQEASAGGGAVASTPARSSNIVLRTRKPGARVLQTAGPGSRHGGGGPTGRGQTSPNGSHTGPSGGPGAPDDSGHHGGSPGSGDHSGPSGGGEDRSGHGGGDDPSHSGSGSSGSGSSGSSGSGSDSSGSDSSGSSGSGSSGSGSSGSGSSGSGSSGSGTSGSGTSGSGSSGSGSGKVEDPLEPPDDHSGPGH